MLRKPDNIRLTSTSTCCYWQQINRYKQGVRGDWLVTRGSHVVRDVAVESVGGLDHRGNSESLMRGDVFSGVEKDQ